jgi:hypothetical protein
MKAIRFLPPLGWDRTAGRSLLAGGFLLLRDSSGVLLRDPGPDPETKNPCRLLDRAAIHFRYRLGRLAVR